MEEKQQPDEKLDGSDSESEETKVKREEDMKKKLMEKWEKMEEEKALMVKKAKEEKQRLKRKRREEEESKLTKFQKLDPHFNPKLKHAKRTIKKLKTQNEAKKQKEDVPELEYGEESIERLQRLQKDAVSLILAHLPDDKSSFFKTLFDTELKLVVHKIRKDVLSYYNMGLINVSIKAIMYMAGISAEDCLEGVESIKKFTHILSDMCDIIQHEIERNK